MPAINTDVIPLVVGLSLCGASAALLYIWFQQQNSNNGDPDVLDGSAAAASSPTTTSTTTRLRRLSRQVRDTAKAAVPLQLLQTLQTKPDSQQRHHIECIIPTHLVPLVEGRAGANVRAIESQTGCEIRFRPRNADDPSVPDDGTSQRCTISGQTVAAVQRAAELVRKEAAAPPIVTEVLRVPVSACGLLIGRGGEALQEICRRTMAKVYVDKASAESPSSLDNPASLLRSIRITGTRPHVDLARTMIEEKIRDTQSGLDTEARREPRGKHNNPLGSPVSEHAATNLTTSNGSSGNSSPRSVPTPATSSQLQQCVSVPPVGDGQLEVYVSAIASPSRFWLQLVGAQSQRLDAMVTEMSDYYSVDENRTLHRIADPYLGQIVAALFKYDGKWYRAEIVGILPNEYNPRNVVLDLYFVDFGDSEYVAPHEVYELRTDFLTLRFQAIECFLANVKSTNLNEPDVWHPDAISRFEEITHVAQWKKMHASIVTTKERKYGDFVRRENSPVPGVELFDCNEINVASTLLLEKYALDDVQKVGECISIKATNGKKTDASGNGASSNVNGTNTYVASKIESLSPKGTAIARQESFIETEKREMLKQQNGGENTKGSP